MVTSYLNGGLGNQLFQIAVAYGLALDNGDRCAFYLDNPVYMQGNPARHYQNNIFSKLVVLDMPFQPERTFEEESSIYKPIPYQKNLILKGYFQSEKYFIKHRDFIIGLFTNSFLIKKLRHEFECVLRDSVAVHIRRGDYVSVGEDIELDYYHTALSLLGDGIKNILIFSDDPDWCKENFLSLSAKTCHVMGNKDYEDMYLISLCSHVITGNSSFSWWGAYLNTNVNKIVYMPRPWTSSHSMDIYPEGVNIIDR